LLSIFRLFYRHFLQRGACAPSYLSRLSIRWKIKDFELEILVLNTDSNRPSRDILQDCPVVGIQGNSRGVTATYGTHFWRHFEQKVSYKPGSYTQYLQSYVRNWKRSTVNCAWPSLT
jgi:hypothetical protein